MQPEPYFMTSSRLGFRCWSSEDLPLARRLWGDIEVTRFFGGPFSEEEIARRLEREIAGMNKHQFQYWPMQIHELGFHLRPEYWGRGLAIEAARAVILFAFNTIGAKGISAGHHPDNRNSQKVLEKLGFRYTHDEFFAALGTDIPYYLLTPCAAAAAASSI
jgi:[ribosomal protein S5]-alanine N-acetyltransferase